MFFVCLFLEIIIFLSHAEENLGQGYDQDWATL